MRHTRKPDEFQKTQLCKAGLSPDNWLVIAQSYKDLVVIHKRSKSVQHIAI